MDLYPKTKELDKIIFTCKGYKVWSHIQMDESVIKGVKVTKRIRPNII